MSVLASVIIAHRGGALLGTENSLSCIEKGIATGADMVEVDLHLTADRQIVVCHDQKVNRTTNGKGRIEDMTLAEIQQLRLLNHDGSVSNETIPTLEQVLELCQGKCALLLEIKKKRDDQYPGIEALADSIVKAHGMGKRSSSNLSTTTCYLSCMPSTPACGSRSYSSCVWGMC